MKVLPLVCFLFLILGSTVNAQSNEQEYREVTWDDLMPEGWIPNIPSDPQFFDHGSVDIVQLDAQQKAQTEIAPVVNSLDQQKLRLPGYIIPIKLEGEAVSEFLLVPYLGACIHVPPPPENQMVYVTLEEPLDSIELWAPVWVNGLMTTQLEITEYATAGYHMKQAETELYQY